MKTRLGTSLKKKVSNMRNKYEVLNSRKALKDPYSRIRESALIIDNLTKRMQDKIKLNFKLKKV